MDFKLFTDIERNRCRQTLDMKDNSQPKTSINKTEKIKPINWVQWSKEIEKYVSQYKTTRMTGVLLSYVSRNKTKRPSITTINLLPKSECKYWALMLDDTNKQYSEDSKCVYLLLG